MGNEQGILQNSEAVARMMVSIGYRGEDIVQNVALDWSEGMDVEVYKTPARAELEKGVYKTFLDSIGMQFLGAGKWDLCGIKGVDSWKTDI